MSDCNELLDCLVAGTGPVGLAAAIALCDRGLRVGLIGPAATAAAAPLDARTFALFEPTLRFLEHLTVWPLPANDVSPLAKISIVDDTGRLMRAPDATFEATEIGRSAFGYNIPHTALVRALTARLDGLAGRIGCFDALLSAVAAERDLVRATLADGRELRARLLIGADGRQSTCRQLGRFSTRRWSYRQAALVVSVAHTRPHGSVSTELHRPAGPLTTVPLPGLASSIVWVERPAEAERLKGLDEPAFKAELHGRLQGLLGRITAIGPRQVYALDGLVAMPAGQHRVALVGEALHAFPPIGAQGLNLGFRDVASLVDAIETMSPSTADTGSDDVLQAYSADRSRDVLFRTLMVDALDRSLTSALPPLQLLRGGGLHLVNRLPVLKKALMRRGLGPISSLPAMMQEP
jgi:2-octaprenyl-6-methoxyphenol hydroxylase